MNSKAFGLGKVIDTGAPAQIELEDEGMSTPSSVIRKINVVGNNVTASSDTNGNVSIEVADQQTVDFMDGGNF